MVDLIQLFTKKIGLCGGVIFRAITQTQWLTNCMFPTTLNEYTNIALIPKCELPKKMKDLRPIYLCNVPYKIVAILANRLERVLSKCISNERYVFIAERSILDHALLVTEVIHYLKCKTKGKMGEVALKIDISKAYDQVRWM